MKTNKKQNKLIISTIAILVIGFLTFSLIPTAGTIYQSDSSINQEFYQKIVLDNTGGSQLTAYQYEIIIPYNPKMQTDFDDVIFLDETKTTPYTIYKESYVDSDTATFFIKLSMDADSTKTIYMKYGDSEATDSSCTPAEMYDFYFGADSTDELTSNFDVISGTNYAIIDGNLEIYSTSGTTQTKLKTKTSVVSLNSIIEAKVKGSSSDMQALSYLTLEDDDSSDAILIYAEGSTTNDNQVFYYSKVSDSYTQVKDITLNDVTQWYIYKSIWTTGHFTSYQDTTLIHDKTDLIPTVDLNYRFSNGASQLDGYTMYHDWVRSRQYVANPPTLTFSTIENQDDKIITSYDIDINNDVTIPISADGSETITKYIMKPTGYSPSFKHMEYDLFEDLTQWTGDTSKYAIQNTYTIDGSNCARYNSQTGIITSDISGFTDGIISYDVKVRSINSNDNFEIYLYNSDKSLNHRIQFSKDTNRPITFDGVTLVNAATNTNYNFKFDVDSTNSEITVYLNDVEKTTQTLKFTDFTSIDIATTWCNDANADILFDNLIIRHSPINPTLTNPPTYVATDMDSYIKLDITNNEATPLSEYKVTIDSLDLDITTSTDSLLIMDECPITMNDELNETSVMTSNNISLNVTFNNVILDAKANITLPNATNENIILSNSGSNVWSTELNYTEAGTYIIDNYFINSESETIDSNLEFVITSEPEEETPTTPSSGGGGSSYVPATEEIIEENTTEIIPQTSEQLDKEEVIDLLNENTLASIFIIIFALFGIFAFITYKNRK